MKTIAITILAALVAILPTAAQDKPAATAPATTAAPEPFDPKDLDGLRAKKGTEVTIQGKVEKAGENRGGTLRYLNFTSDYKKSISLVFPVFKNSVEFTNEKLKAWVGKTVSVSGTVKEYNGQLQIEIAGWDQVKEVEKPVEKEAPPAEKTK